MGFLTPIPSRPVSTLAQWDGEDMHSSAGVENSHKAATRSHQERQEESTHTFDLDPPPPAGKVDTNCEMSNNIYADPVLGRSSV